MATATSLPYAAGQSSNSIVPDNNFYACITLTKHGEIIAYSTNRTVTFWDTSRHSQLGPIQHPQDIRDTRAFSRRLVSRVTVYFRAPLDCSVSEQLSCSDRFLILLYTPLSRNLATLTRFMEAGPPRGRGLTAGVSQSHLLFELSCRLVCNSGVQRSSTLK